MLRKCNALPEFLLRKAAQKYQTLRNSKGISRTKVSEIFQISRGDGRVKNISLFMKYFSKWIDVKEV